jgi:two-component system LytT family sensor kinase
MRKKYKIGLHILIWFLVFLNDFLPKYLNNNFRSYSNSNSSAQLLNYFLICLGYLGSGLVSFYTTANLIAPSFLSRKWLKGLLYTFLLFVFIPSYRYLLEFHFFLPYLGFDNYFGNKPEVTWYIQNSVLYTFYRYFIYGFLYFIVTEWYSNHGKQKELEKEKITAELAFLKSQINPHFLFNTLNDIYALTYHKSEKAPDAVLKLSDLLRYMLKESEGKFADLKKEIDYLKNVIDLFQIGQKGSAAIEFKVDGEVDKQQIAPLILINFIENAFKHGVIDNPLWPIHIKIHIDLNGMDFFISNQKNKDYKDQTVGIGLVNVKRRLELIYPHQHWLEIKDEADTFTVTLKIKWI